MISAAPQTGEKISLGTLVSQVRVTAMPGDLPIDTHFIGLEDIVPHEGQISSVSQISDVKSRVYRFQSEDVLYGRLRPYLRKVALVDFEGSASGEIIVLRCSEKIIPRYLLILLLSEDFTNFVNSRTKGDRPRTSFEIIASYLLEIPSLEVQAEICMRDCRLLSAMSKLEGALASHEFASLSIINTLRTRLMWGSASDEILVPLADALETIDYGTSQKSSYDSVGMPTLRIPNITSFGEIDATDLKYSPLNERESEKYRLKVGDILLIRSNGSLSLVGRAAKVSKEQENYAFAGYLLRIRASDKVLSDYLLELVRSVPFQRMVEAAARSSTGINNLSASRLAAFIVPILPLKRQKRIVDALIRLQQVTASSSESLRQMWLSAKTLREAARGVWLGHSVMPLPGRLLSTANDEHVKSDDHLSERNLEMDENIEVTILRRLEAMPLRSASFEFLSEGIKAEYDVLRDAVFKLLSLSPPRLIQVFDEKSRSIILRRPA